MQQNYSKKIEPIQKASKNTASSVLDASSQSEALQRKADMANNAAQREEAPRPNNTGMPDNLKSGIESLSGFSMDDVRVHYNSSKPATVQALAYTQGTDIHVAPGQEKHLPHEAWHVAQQMAGRVSPTTNINGMPVNDNAVLEHEADVMGEKAVQCKTLIDGGKKSIYANKESVQLKKCIQRVGDKIHIQHVSPDGPENTDVQNVRQQVLDIYNVYVDRKKHSREEERTNHQATLKSAATTEEAKNAAVKGYEESQISHRLNVNELIQQLRDLRIPGVEVNQDVGTSSYSLTYRDEYLFFIWVDNERFDRRDLKPEEQGLRNLYVRRGEGASPSIVGRAQPKDYIFTRNGCYIPRYVYRYLNSFDTEHFLTDTTNGTITGIGNLNLCEIDPRNPFYLKDDVKNINLGFYKIYCNDSIGWQSLNDRTAQDYFLDQDLPDCSIQKNNHRNTIVSFLPLKKKLKLKCASIRKPRAPVNESTGDRFNKVFVLINRMIRNVQPAAFESLYHFFEIEENRADEEGRHFWTLYNGSLNGDMAVNQAILEHMRSKEKQGGSGFISCTATKHPIFGSGGSDFFRAKKGLFSAVAKIDLAKIPRDVNIYSTYSKEAMRVLFNTTQRGSEEVIPQTRPHIWPTPNHFDRNSAARDAMRTREILIDGPIPQSAIEAVYYNHIGQESVFQNNPSDGRTCWPPHEH
ncbi:MAG: DUF4157 domain-containing protein [Fibrobacter sp.]|nr:DUF4157 domain-containing protein [Fibrobacter sp.]